MFVSSSTYKHELKKLVDSEEGELRVAVAFWGKGALNHIHPDETRLIRVICNLLSGGTNPNVIEALWERSKSRPKTVKIYQCDRLHAKVILGSKQALVGSANLSSNGLSLEDDEMANWLEAGILTSNAEELGRIGKWFEELWSSEEMRPIRKRDLLAAKAAWNKRRGARTNTHADTSEPFSLDRWTAAQLSDRPVYMLIYRVGFSPAGKKEHKKAQEEFEASSQEDSSSNALWSFERWNHFPKGTPGQNIELVVVYWKEGSAPVCEGASRSLDVRRPFKHKNGRGSWLDLTMSSPSLLQQKFGKKQQLAITRRVEDCIKKIWKAAEVKDPYGRVLPLSDVARIINET